MVNVYGSGQYYKGQVDTPVEYISIDPDTQMMTYYRGETILLQSQVPNRAELNESMAGREVSREDLSFVLVNDEYDIRLELQNYVVLNPEYKDNKDESSRYYNISGIALIRDAK